ncbi:PAS domain S-box protein [Phenylobacterium sp.]|uniref:sensor histidine kinase n=1 Tax=Phenylobacterium sp. TaxID=1871053 RepID=UPI002F955B0C
MAATLETAAKGGIPDRSDTLEDFFENGAVGLHLVDGGGRILRANRAELQLLGYQPEEYLGRQISDFHADAGAIEDILARLSRGETLDKYPARLKAKDGSIKHVLISSSVCFDEAGNFRNTRCFTVDVTDRVAADAELREAQQRLAATYEHALAGIAEVDCHGRFLRVNEPFHEITGYNKAELLGRCVFDITHPEDAPADRSQFERQVRGDIERYATQKRYLRADGRCVWVHVMSSTVHGPDGEFLYGVRVVHDVTEQKQAEERRRLLVAELNHRVKNTLSTVQSLASQTARNARDLDDFQDRFEGRLVALSKAHDRLTRRSWADASLAEIVEEELGFRGGGRAVVAGPDVALSPHTALALSMAFHELGTNAAKYGALSSPDGRISVHWNVERDRYSRPVRVSLTWMERGGPTVKPPESRGFGSRLLDAMAAELNGAAELRFEPEGLVWSLEFPLQLAA